MSQEVSIISFLFSVGIFFVCVCVWLCLHIYEKVCVSVYLIVEKPLTQFCLNNVWVLFIMKIPRL